MEDAVAKFLNQLDESRKKKEPLSKGVDTGYAELDSKTCGLQRGELIVIGSRVSMGKTSLALNIAKNVSSVDNQCVLYFSLEMSSEQLINRIMTMASKVDGEYIRSGSISDNEWEKIIDAANSIGNARLIVDDTPGNAVESINDTCRACREKYGVDLVIIDYLQLITTKKAYERRQEVVAAIVGTLKMLAKELNIPVVVLSQISRDADKRDDHRPILADFREGAAVEEDADTVIFIYRDDYYNKDSAHKNIAEIILAKQTNGRCGTVYLNWNPRFCLFDNYYEDRPKTADLSKIVDTVCGEYGIDKESLLSKKRTSEIVLARQTIMYLCREYTDMSLEEIGKAVGSRDHTVVMSGISKIKSRISSDDELGERIGRLSQRMLSISD
ncbi:MAG: AAA family ATPase [Oribacterium sp.]|nr:AAA family ATPase [Oribacterium sp.]